jgi:hypothetical protein
MKVAAVATFTAIYALVSKTLPSENRYYVLHSIINHLIFVLELKNILQI